MKVTILSGSARQFSTTIRLANAINNRFNENEVQLIDFYKYDIPNFNQNGIDFNNLTDFQKNLYNSMSSSKLIFILTPEYNWMPSAEIIQFVNQMTSKEYNDMWNNKVFAFAGVSSGRGGRIPAIQLSNMVNKILNVFNYESMVSAKIFESQFTLEALSAEGESLGNTQFDKGLDDFINYSIKMAERF